MLMLRLQFLGYLLLLALVLVGAANDINLKVYPSAILHGNSVWLTCRVTPHPMNRRLEFGVKESSRDHSEIQLEGSKAPITHGPFEVKGVECEQGPAYCIVYRADGTSVRAMQSITIAGCEGAR